MTKEPFPKPFEVISPYEENKLKKKTASKNPSIDLQISGKF